MVLSGIATGVVVAAAPWLVAALAPGFPGEARALTTDLVRILFPMSGVMIIGAWCLGILTSNGRFFLPFVAPVIWNLAQIIGLLIGTSAGWEPLVVTLAWSTLIGSVLQVGLQLPAVKGLLGGLRISLERGFAPVQRVVKNAGPVALGQGIFQVSSVMEGLIGSLLATGALTSLYFAQRLALLPLALVGSAVAVAALPAMSREDGIQSLGTHFSVGTRRILYFILPSMVAMMLFGDLAASVLFQRGAFGEDDVRAVYGVLIAYGIGLVPTSLVKLKATGFYALGDTKSPVRYAFISITTGLAIGTTIALLLDRRGLGAVSIAGLVAGGSVGGWVNLTLLARGLRRRGAPAWLRQLGWPILRMIASAVLAGAGGFGVRQMAESMLPDAALSRLITLTSVGVVMAGIYLPLAGSPRRLAGR